jgi:hypothetical protein
VGRAAVTGAVARAEVALEAVMVAVVREAEAREEVMVAGTVEVARAAAMVVVAKVKSRATVTPRPGQKFPRTRLRRHMYSSTASSWRLAGWQAGR